jgi:hypothetical protein
MMAKSKHKTKRKDQTMSVTQEQLKVGLATMLAVSESIREAGSIPEGHLYAVLIDRMDINAFNSLVRALVRTGLVKSENHLLTWTGPTIA